MTGVLNKEELLQEISLLLKDELVANISSGQNSLQITFSNGQRFELELTEI